MPIGRYYVIAINHYQYRKMERWELNQLSKDKIILFDVKGALSESESDLYWKL